MSVHILYCQAGQQSLLVVFTWLGLVSLLFLGVTFTVCTVSMQIDIVDE